MYRKVIVLISVLLFSTMLSARDFKPGEAYQAILQRKILRVGISMHYPPLNFNRGKKGAEMEMARKLGKFLNVKIKLVALPVNQYVSSLSSGRVDIIIAGLSRNLERAERIWFSVPYLRVTPGVLANRSKLPKTSYGSQFEQTPIKTLWDLQRVSGFTMAVKKGSSYQQLLLNRMKSMSTILVTSNKAGMQMLKDGKVDGFIHDSLYLQYQYRKSARYRRNYKLLKGGKQSEKICIGLPKGDTVLKTHIDLFIKEIIRQGYIDEWLKKYNR